MIVEKFRDLTLVNINESSTMVIACDSCGSVGMKQYDILKIPPVYTGKFTARVGIMEVICTGAEVVAVVDAVCNEMEPTGNEIIRGIREELKAANINEIVLTGSVEKNFPTFSTALGITVIGIAEKNKLKIKNIKEDAVIVSVGLPKLGHDIHLDADEEIVDYAAIDYLLGSEEVYEILPVGSKGILSEAELLAETNGFNLSLEKHISVDVLKSAGPSTCLVAAVKKKYLDRLKCLRNCNIIGSVSL